MTRDEYVLQLKSYLLTLQLSAAKAFFASNIPFLATGIPWKIIEQILNKLFLFINDQIEMVTFFKYTDFRSSKQGRDFYNALMINKKAQKEGSDEDKKIAEDNLKQAFRTLIVLTS